MVFSAVAFGVALFWQPDPEALAQLFRRALEMREKQFGQEHPKVARAASDLGLFLRNQGDRAAAQPHLRRALEIDEKVLPADDPLLGEDLENLASVASAGEALVLYRRAAEHKDAAVSARNLARVAEAENSRGNKDAALALYRQALAREEQATGPKHPRVAVRLNDVALLVEPREAEPLLRRALAIQENSVGPRHPETAVTLNNLANVLLATGRVAQAEPVAQRALEILAETLGRSHPRVATSASNLGDILRARRNYAGARRYYETALSIDEKAYGPAHPEVAADLENLASLLDEMGRPEEARRLRLRSASIKARRE